MNTKNFLIIVPTLLIGIIIVLNVIGNMTETINDSSEAIKFSNNCSDGRDAYGIRLEYNLSSGNCYNSSGNDLYPAKLYPIPLSSIITSISVLLIMIGVFILLIVMTVREMRK